VESIKSTLFKNGKDGELNDDIISILNEQNHVVLPKGVTRQAKVDAAMDYIAPRSSNNNNEWSVVNQNTGSSTISADANNLLKFLGAITSWNYHRAAEAINRLLARRECTPIKKLVRSTVNGLATLAVRVTSGMKLAIAHHTNPGGGTRTIPAETLVKNTVLTAVWGFVERGEDVPVSDLIQLLGTTQNQISIASDIARELIENNNVITPLERMRRSDFIRDKLLPYLYDWVMDDDVTRFDSNQYFATIDNPKNPGEEIHVHQRIWRLTNKEQQHKKFLESRQYREFISENNAAGVGYTVFRDGIQKLRKIVSDPKPESCVDEKVSGMEHAMEALFALSRNDSAVKKAFESYQAREGEIAMDDFVKILQRRSSHKLVKSVCCEEVEEKDLHIDKSQECPKMIPLGCTHGVNGDPEDRCSCCGFKRRLGNFFDVLKNDEDIRTKAITVMVWEDARRQGQSKGKDNKQKELTSKVMTVEELLDHFEKLLNICIPHVQEIRWMKHLQDTDFSKLSRDTILIFTDFAAVMALRARQAKNSSVDAHAIIANFVILWNKRDVKAKGKKKGKNGEEMEFEEKVTISNVDVVHFFAETFEKGKKNDHVMHNACLDEIIRKYRAKLRERGDELKHVIIWTDNAPHQYRCRQTFRPEGPTALCAATMSGSRRGLQDLCMEFDSI
jgi:hypothetical protein